jgi:hypothetical protein
MRRASCLTSLTLATAVVVGAACASVPPDQSPATGLEWMPVLAELGLRDPSSSSWRSVFSSGFESDADFSGFYVTPQSAMTRHEVVAGGERHRGARSHHGWLTGVTGAEPVDGPNHRGYPTIQLARRSAGVCSSPCLIEFWVRLDDSQIGQNEWISLATFSPDGSDRWARVVTVNVGSEGWLFLFHVPTQGSGERAFQRSDAFPRDRWVRVTTLLDLRPEGGAAAVWQDGTLVSAARSTGATAISINCTSVSTRRRPCRKAPSGTTTSRS